MKIQYEIGDHVLFLNEREFAEVGVVSRLCNLGVIVQDSAQRALFRGYRQIWPTEMAARTAELA